MSIINQYVSIEFEVCGRKEFWDYIIVKENWKNWWGSEILEVNQDWENNAVIKWGNGNSSIIKKVIAQEKIIFMDDWIETTLVIDSSMDCKYLLITIIQEPINGASFKSIEDKKNDLQKRLEKLKKELIKVENQANKLDVKEEPNSKYAAYYKNGQITCNKCGGEMGGGAPGYMYVQCLRCGQSATPEVIENWPKE